MQVFKTTRIYLGNNCICDKIVMALRLSLQSLVYTLVLALFVSPLHPWQHPHAFTNSGSEY